MKSILSVTIALATLFSVDTVFAQSPGLRSPLKTDDKGTTFEMCYDISGLGNVTEVKMHVTYNAFVESQCYNPGKDAGPVPGQSKSFPGQGEDFVVPVHNGRATGCFTTTKTFPAGACPNSKWTGVVSDVTFSNVSLTVYNKTFKAPDPQ